MIWWLLLILSPFIIYAFFRLMFGAFFASWYEAKFHYVDRFLKKGKELKNGV